MLSAATGGKSCTVPHLTSSEYHACKRSAYNLQKNTTQQCNRNVNYACEFVQINGIHGNPPFLHLGHLLDVWFLAQYGCDTLVNAHGVEGETDRQEGVHLVILLLYLYRIQDMSIYSRKIIHQSHSLQYKLNNYYSVWKEKTATNNNSLNNVVKKY